MQRAYAQANETVNQANAQAQSILDAATTDSNNIRLSAISYTDDMLANMAQIMESTGVCTRPTRSRVPYRQVNNLVPLMPTSQSAWDLARAD